MIIRHYHTMRQYHERHDPRPLTHAGRFWLLYLIGVALVAAWVVA